MAPMTCRPALQAAVRSAKTPQGRRQIEAIWFAGEYAEPGYDSWQEASCKPPFRRFCNEARSSDGKTRLERLSVNGCPSNLSIRKLKANHGLKLKTTIKSALF